MLKLLLLFFIVSKSPSPPVNELIKYHEGIASNNRPNVTTRSVSKAKYNTKPSEESYSKALKESQEQKEKDERYSKL